MSTASALARWAVSFEPSEDDLALAELSLVDTLAVTLAARRHAIAGLTTGLGEAARWAAVGHVLDFDDVHVEANSHVSVVIIPAVLAVGGDARAYLAGAGAMARLGRLLGWQHYAAGWHATCTQGAPAAALAAGIALGLEPQQLAIAMALAVPAAGGVQAAFGTHGKALQVGFAAEAGVRAARLARAGATADPAAVDQWLDLLDAKGELDDGPPVIPGGLAIKLHPCCYAMQRPIAAIRQLREQCQLDAASVQRVRVTTPQSGMQPLLHDRPRTGLEGKFSMPYAIAATLLDGFPGFDSFTDAAVNRPQAQRLIAAVETTCTPGGNHLLYGEIELRIELLAGHVLHTRLALPPGAPENPPSADELAGKYAACGPDVAELLAGVTWASAPDLLRRALDQPDGSG